MSVPVYATSPLPYAVAGAVLLVVLWRFLPLWLAIAGVAVELLLVASMTPLGADLWVRAAEARAPSAGACAAPVPTTVVVLGAGFAHSPNGAGDFGALRDLGLQRVFAGVALWRDIPAAHLVLSGGAGYIPEAVVMANLAMRLGVPASAIRIEPGSHSTWENAQRVAELIPRVPQRIWLVTSPMHLPRALGAFRAWGFTPCAWSAGPRQAMPSFSPRMVIPQATAVRKTTYALHELVGGVVYKLLARRHARSATPSRAP